MKRLAYPIVVLLLGWILPLQAQDPPKVKTPYFPLEKGTKWTYKAGDKKFRVEVVGFEKGGKDNKENCVKLETRSVSGVAGEDKEKEKDKDKEKLIATELVTIRDDGVYRCAFAGSQADPPVCFLKLDTKDPAKMPPKETWTFTSKIAGQETKGSFSQAEEKGKIKLGGKEYDNVVKVTSQDMKVDNQSVTVTYYFAKDYGMIKQEVDIAGSRIDVELEKFDKPK